MKQERPILFSTPMVKAILEGRKTVTRRIVKLKNIDSSNVGSINKDGSGNGWIAWSPKPVSDETTKKLYPGESGFKCPYGKKGDILWVRESWFPAAVSGKEILIGYSANGENAECLEIKVSDNPIFYWHQLIKGRTIPSIHMPKEASRIWLEITDVWVEKLQDITENGAVKEGINPLESFNSGCGISSQQLYENYLPQGYTEVLAKDSFESLWCSINGTESWTQNPWVWVVEFKVLSTTGRPASISV
jgi:hypothetical protein